jgi:FdhD protein
LCFNLCPHCCCDRPGDDFLSSCLVPGCRHCAIPANLNSFLIERTGCDSDLLLIVGRFLTASRAAAIGVAMMVSVSTPTALAVRTADAAGITLAAVARADGFEVFTHPGRISRAAAAAMTG